MADRIWIRDPLATFTATEHAAPRGVVIEGGVITELVGAGGPAAPVQREFDARAHVLTPGLVNCHHHFYQTLTRALPERWIELFDWLQALYPVWSGLGQEDIAASGARTGGAHAVGLYDGSGSPLRVPRRLEEAIDIKSKRSSGSGSGPADAGLGESRGFRGGLPRTWSFRTKGRSSPIANAPSRASTTRPRMPACVSRSRPARRSPCQPSSCAKRPARAATGVRLHTHLGETHDEDAWCLETHGMRPVDYLEHCEWLADDVWLAHGIHFEAEEIARLGAARTGICHCPSSNMLLGSGICPVGDLEAAGAPVGLGVDGSASNDCSNLITEARQAMLLQKLARGSAAVTAQDALRWATAGGADVLAWPEIGRLEIGARADLALFDLEALRFSGVGDPLSGLLYSGATQVDALMVDGEWRVRDGALVDFDLDALRARHGASARRLQGRL